MTVRCLFMTSSYLRTFLRISKFCCSICVWADWIAFETGLASIGTSSGSRRKFIIAATRSPLKRTIRSSPSER